MIPLCVHLSVYALITLVVTVNHNEDKNVNVETTTNSHLDVRIEYPLSCALVINGPAKGQNNYYRHLSVLSFYFCPCFSLRLRLCFSSCLDLKMTHDPSAE